MRLPFVVAMVSPNSSLMCVRYDRNEAGDGLTAKLLAECGADFALPINIMIADQTGEAIHVTIAEGGHTSSREDWFAGGLLMPEKQP
jgi:hypothetical protein